MDPAPEPLPDLFVLDGALAADLRREGELTAFRQALLAALEVCFGEVPAAWSRRIAIEPDVARLQTWHARALSVRSLAQLEGEL